MKKKSKILTTFVLCISIMANCLPVQAAVTKCDHWAARRMERNLVYGRIVNEHEVVLKSNNMIAKCYDYEYSYVDKWCCQDCGEYFYVTVTDDPVCSLEGLYYK